MNKITPIKIRTWLLSFYLILPNKGWHISNFFYPYDEKFQRLCAHYLVSGRRQDVAQMLLLADL